MSECLDYRLFEAPDLHPYVTSETLQELGLVEYKVEYKVDFCLFVCLIHFRLITMILLMSLILS